MQNHNTGIVLLTDIRASRASLPKLELTVEIVVTMYSLNVLYVGENVYRHNPREIIGFFFIYSQIYRVAVERSVTVQRADPRLYEFFYRSRLCLR